MVRIFFKDRTVHEFEKPVSGVEVARMISQSLTKNGILCKVNGTVMDLATTIPDGAMVEIMTLKSQGILDVLRHSTAHLAAKAVQSLFPKVKFAVGPATEDGFFYDFQMASTITPDDLIQIERRMQSLVVENLPFERILMSRSEAIALFKAAQEDFKVEILKGITDEMVSIYKLGDWYDLCRGPHLPSTQYIGTVFKLTKVSGAYWRGDKTKAPLQRIYGTVWPSREEMDAYFLRLEEAEKRDHRTLGVELDLFHMQDLAPGTVFWHTKGWTLYRTLKNFIRKRIEDDGYKEVNTPMIIDRCLWEKSGHWDKFKENMFITELEDKRVMAIKPMNCPCHIQIFNQGIVSYKDLPWRMAEFGSCHRYEPSGALHGLMRVRGFVQDDAHIFCTPDQIISETKKFCELLRGIYKSLGFDQFFVKFSDRPEKRAGSDAIWDLAEKSLRDAAKEANLDYTLNPGEGAFYGPKLEFVLKDCLGRDWQCGTLQVDFVMPERLKAEYITEKGTKQHPVMLHRAILGSMERFIGILIEQYAGNFPCWLAPVQAVVATITEEADSAAQQFFAQLRENNVRAELDIRNEKIAYKVREHSMQKIPYILVLGKKEKEEGTVTVRQIGSDQQKTMLQGEAIHLIIESSRIP